MPSSSPLQAKTMSAIAHGWRPTGSAAGIPVRVAKEFHAADKGKKYGAKVGKLRKRGLISDKAHSRMQHPELRGRINAA